MGLSPAMLWLSKPLPSKPNDSDIRENPPAWLLDVQAPVALSLRHGDKPGGGKL